MSILTLHRHLFAPAYTETQYTPSGSPQTTTLKSEVSSGQQTATKWLPSATPPLGSREMGDPVEMASPPKGLFLLLKTKGDSRRSQANICCFLSVPSPLLAKMVKQKVF